MPWTIEYARSVRKTVRKLNPTHRQRIRGFLETRLAELDDPRSLGKAQFSNLWRYRVGDYRIIADIQDKTVTILIVRIGDRKDVYS